MSRALHAQQSQKMKRSSSLNDSQASGSTSHEALDSPGGLSLPSSTSAGRRASCTDDVRNRFANNSTSNPTAMNSGNDSTNKSSTANTDTMGAYYTNGNSSSNFDYFLSDPSHSESEHDDSLVDRQRQSYYRKRRYEVNCLGRMVVDVSRDNAGDGRDGSNKNNGRDANRIESPHHQQWDNSSFGNTSLSSSNSPMPRARIQLDGLGLIQEGDGVEQHQHNDLHKHQQQQGDGQNQHQQGDYMQKQLTANNHAKKKTISKIKLRLPFVRMTSETSDSISDVDLDYYDKMATPNGAFHTPATESKDGKRSPLDNTSRSALVDQNHFRGSLHGDGLEAALMPPSTASDEGYLQHSNIGNIEGVSEQQQQMEQHQRHSLSQNTNSQSTTTLQGVELVTEQAGGESSSSVIVSSLDSGDRVSPNHAGSKLDTMKINANDAADNIDSTTANGPAFTVTTANSTSNHPNLSLTAKKSKPKKRLRFSNTPHSNTSHRRQRSGDQVAAGIVLKNTQQKVDWIGMRRDGLLAPTRTGNATAGSAAIGDGVSNNDAIIDNLTKNNMANLFGYGSVTTNEGDSMSGSPSNGIVDRTHVWQASLPRKSSHLSFSDSSAPTSPPEGKGNLGVWRKNEEGRQQQKQSAAADQELNAYFNKQHVYQIGPSSYEKGQHFMQWQPYQNKTPSEQEHNHHKRSRSGTLSSYQQHLQESYSNKAHQAFQRRSSLDNPNESTRYRQEQLHPRPHSNSLSSYQLAQQHQQNQQQRPHSNSLSSYERVWDGENAQRFQSNQMGSYGSNRQQVSWDPSTSYGSWNSSLDLHSQQALMMQMSTLTDGAFRSGESPSIHKSWSDSIGSSSNILYSTHISERKSRDKMVESDSGSSDSASSSSFEDDRSSLSRARTNEFQKLKNNHHASRPKSARFDKVMQRVANALDAPIYHQRKKDDEKANAIKPPPTFFCPNCKTEQRAFIDITTAASQFESPLGYFTLYFALYLVSILFVFGLEEGWTPLDCVYFAVVTLTTAGLGDFVPSSNMAKLICACFIYFGVATIGLLLGSILAGSLDDASKKDHHEALIRDCPNCLRLEMQRKRHSMNPSMHAGGNSYYNHDPVGFEQNHVTFIDANSTARNNGEGSIGLNIKEPSAETPPQVAQLASQGSNVTPSRRQSHTKHMSLAFGATEATEFLKTVHKRRMSADFDTINENSPFLERSSSSYMGDPTQNFYDSKPVNNDDTSTGTTSTDSSSNLTKPMSRLKAVKYIVLTLNRALLNSLLIIFIGSSGFYFIEGMPLVDSFYFTTVLLTTGKAHCCELKILPAASTKSLLALLFSGLW